MVYLTISYKMDFVLLLLLPQVAEYIHRAVEIAKDCRDKTPAPGKLKEFKAYLANEGQQREDIKQLRKEVEGLAASFPMPGL